MYDIADFILKIILSKNISYINIVSGYGISKLRKIIIIKSLLKLNRHIVIYQYVIFFGRTGT